jgi:hypothetical protein
MPPALVGGFLVLHGLITTIIGVGGVTNPDAPVGSVGLVALALYFDPIYVIAVLINVVLVALVWGRLAPAS